MVKTLAAILIDVILSNEHWCGVVFLSSYETHANQIFDQKSQAEIARQYS